ncbi:MAG: Intermediate filament protein [Peltula sp. TS41687]|nr:MAG: Intermediate filament protein [Peltula sp. TS41687]
MALRARNLVLSGVACFIAWGWIVHWLPVLRFIEYAFIIGAVCSATTLLLPFLLVVRRSPDDEDHEEDDISHHHTTFAFLASKAWKAEVAALSKRTQYRQQFTLYPLSAAVSAVLDDLLQLMQRDLIKSWYCHITLKPTFNNEVDKVIRATLADLRDRLHGIDLVQIGVARIVPIVTEHLSDFYHAERLVRGPNLERHVTESQELDLAIAGKYRDGKLHPAVMLASSKVKHLQQQYLRGLLETVIKQALPSKQTHSRAVVVLIREILACAVLCPIMQICADPDTWNQLIEAYVQGRTLLQDRKSVRRLRAALDEHASPGSKSKRASGFPKLAPHDSERNFERFISRIRQCKNLADARRLRSEIASQLKRDTAVEGQDQIYLRRLEIGKQLLDQRIANLTATPSSSNRSRSQVRIQQVASSARLETFTLAELLRDPMGLSYFMEFMDRQGKMTLVQFWLVVDGLRNPLEVDLTEEENPTTAAATWTESDLNDLSQINKAYLSKPELIIPDGVREIVNKFLTLGMNASPGLYHKARQAILRAQSAALEEMQNNQFPAFKKSDLYFKYLTSDETSEIRGPSAPSPTRRTTGLQPTSLHAGMQSNLKVNPLRRSATSYIDTKLSSSGLGETALLRRPLEGRLSSPLFEEELESDHLSNSVQSIDSEQEFSMGQDGPDYDIVRAMEDALNDIIKEGPDAVEADTGSVSAVNPGLDFLSDTGSGRSSIDMPQQEALGHKQIDRPSIASLGLVKPSSRIGVFTDDDLFPDEQKFIEDEHDDPEESINEKEEETVEEVPPGNLWLAEAVSVLNAEIDRLTTQENVLKSLTLKAELTNNAAELRILRKSKTSLEREIRRKELQRQQYILQESDNDLHGRATIRITSVMVGTEEDGHEFAIYVIEVNRLAGEQVPAATWAVARRYSEFHGLHQRLRPQHPSVRHLDFPRRRVMRKLQRDFLQKRRLALERYLRELLLIPEVCRSRELRAFLSQHVTGRSNNNPSSLQKEPRDMISRLYSSLTSGMDDILGNIPVLDQLSVAGQNLIAAATQQLNTTNITGSSSAPTTTTTTHLPHDPEAEAELNAYTTIKPPTTEDSPTPEEQQPFVKPIVDIFLEAFELNKGNNWLRGRAVVMILQQLLGGTIERKTRESIRRLTQDDALARYLTMVRDLLWPDGTLRRGPVVRTPAQKTHSRTEASLVLATLIPDLAGSVVGRANAQAAGRKVFAAVSNQVLNTHLAYTILDEVIDVLYGLPGGPARSRR